jgi:hypothetical protein
MRRAGAPAKSQQEEQARQAPAAAKAQQEERDRQAPAAAKAQQEEQARQAAAAVKAAEENALKSVDDALAKLIQANVAFNVPEHMRVARTQTLQAKLGVKMTPDELIATLTAPGKRESEPLKVSKEMSASLGGGGAFNISPSGPQTQLISEAQETSWS